MARNEATDVDAELDDASTERADGWNASASPDATETAPATIIATDGADRTDETTFPNEVTVVGHGAPSSFEITVDGAIDAAGARETTVVSGTTVEGTVETGTVAFRFDGDLVDVTFVDRKITGHSPAAAPNVHVDYGTAE
ncbi:hypothetical protein [Halopiger xanaduensis]|uniref:Uncharacterized protein n=1 Tax=Halopiger xanaduensis (strain DSM 18323 / JCM 14033 / SH-6) TaxID=797210 RepID=F8D4V9_HALXS|nr:hypothetical protein [Halopiger xanaduensis]AEH37586.1 hypothetical protein Halxa_2970 [Halopiger xanaduensis SH-6]